MKVAHDIFLRDFNKLRTNVIAIIVILGICILPSLYAWFNIAAIWNPYGNTGDIPVAVVNDDKGATLKGINVNVGNQIVNNLRANKQMGWTFLGKKQAMDGIHEGKFYAVVYIPRSFSEDMVSFATGEIQRPNLVYYVNEKKNGIAPKITDKGVEAIQSQVNSSFVATITTYVTDILKVGTSNAKVTKEDVINNINETMDKSLKSLEELKKSIQIFQANIDSISSLLDATANLSNSVDKTLTGAQDGLAANLKTVQELHSKVDKKAFPDLDKLFTDTEDKMSEVISGIKSTQGGLESSQDVLGNLRVALQSTKKSLGATESIVDNSIERIKHFRSESDGLNISDAFMDALNKAIQHPEKVGEFMSSPCKVDTVPVFPVKDYGSTMAPFYTTLAIWVGGIIMVAIMKVTVHADDKIRHVTLRQAYLGRFYTFCIIGLVQALIISLGNLYFLHMQSTNPGLFIFTCLLTSFVFTLIIYTLTVSFGSIGKALCVIWLVIQVAGSGGTYPIEVLPDAFKFSSHFMPFTFACNAMRETVAGVYTPDYIMDLLKLLVFVPTSLLLGLVLRNPLYRLNEFFERRLEDTEFMG